MLEATGSAAAALALGPLGWREARLTDAQQARLRRPDAARLDAHRAWLDTPGRRLVGWCDPDYPPQLKRSPSPPLALFVVGEPARLWHPTVAVIGSRAATPAGRENAARFADAFARAGFAVGSGLAAGIDAAAHRAALDRGALTIAVLGTGPDVAYPPGNRDLHARIATEGVLVSEHPPGTGPRREHFPSRNRILAGLSLGVVVIEAAERSGALITARLAAEAGREVFALPGSIHNPLARGCHRLIRDGATLVETHSEVTAALANPALELASNLRGRLATPIQHHGVAGLSSSAAARPEGLEGSVWDAIGDDPVGIDTLALRTGLTPAALSSMLLAMELDGRIVTQHGRYYRVR
ncbi:DNA-processing protein DprA [Cognatilysobacter bugurensis]|uniref:DNA-processing protein DprA n=1 Tax=Cognatilysobacter bugurensis TaxID=543356 RepID=UPI001E4F5363|nr:DNA-processing protein DprA [Lysobacter bugurensis]